MELQKQIEYALIEKGLVHQLGAEYISTDLAPFIAEKISVELGKKSELLKVAKEALEFYADDSEWLKNHPYERWCLRFNSGTVDASGYATAKQALAKIEEMEK